jgi:peptidoglycan hydrolase-like protein with peptidoglycan-binding domain
VPTCLARLRGPLVLSALLLAGCVPQASPPAAPPTVTASQAPANRADLIRDVQRMLTERGLRPGAVDGVDGARTREALASFQRAQQLPVTTGVNDVAWAQLRNAQLAAAAAAAPAPNRTTVTPMFMVPAAEREALVRAQMSRNDPRVTFRRDCPGLFIPEITQDMFRGAVPVIAMRVLNNSDTRYRVTYDVTFRSQTNNVFGNFAETSTTERNFISRPRQAEEFLLAQTSGPGRGIQGVERLVVLSCEAT